LTFLECERAVVFSAGAALETGKNGILAPQGYLQRSAWALGGLGRMAPERRPPSAYYPT
jgi:hypothetical protein